MHFERDTFFFMFIIFLWNSCQKYFVPSSCVYIGEVKSDNASDSDMWLLVLATMGSVTEEIGSFLFFVTLPKVTKASK